jgi:hypothetical protein
MTTDIQGRAELDMMWLAAPGPVCLVPLVYLVCLVCFVEPEKPNKPDEPGIARILPEGWGTVKPGTRDE